MTTRHKVLIASEWGYGKSVLALSYSRFMPQDEDMLTLDYEDGQEYYIAPTREQANPEKCLFFARRVLAPSVYEVKAIVHKIIDPERPGKELVIDRKPIQPQLLSKEVKALMAEIGERKLNPTAICFDTVTRLCELTVGKVFGDLIDRRGEDFADKMSQLTWAKVKDDLSELFYQIITEARLSLIMTAWAKNKFDKETRQSTKELIADVLKNVNAFVSLGLMLEKSANPRIRVPRATVTKSRLIALPQGATLEKATWDAIFAAEPQFTFIDPTPDQKEVA